MSLKVILESHPIKNLYAVIRSVKAELAPKLAFSKDKKRHSKATLIEHILNLNEMGLLKKLPKMYVKEARAKKEKPTPKITVDLEKVKKSGVVKVDVKKAKAAGVKIINEPKSAIEKLIPGINVNKDKNFKPLKKDFIPNTNNLKDMQKYKKILNEKLKKKEMTKLEHESIIKEVNKQIEKLKAKAAPKAKAPAKAKAPSKAKPKTKAQIEGQIVADSLDKPQTKTLLQQLEEKPDFVNPTNVPNKATAKKAKKPRSEKQKANDKKLGEAAKARAAAKKK